MKIIFLDIESLNIYFLIVEKIIIFLVDFRGSTSKQKLTVVFELLELSALYWTLCYTLKFDLRYKIFHVKKCKHISFIIGNLYGFKYSQIWARIVVKNSTWGLLWHIFLFITFRYILGLNKDIPKLNWRVFKASISCKSVILMAR